MTKEPLFGLRVLDFSSLLPGPLTTLYLAQAGAEVIKIERPSSGDPIRQYPPFSEGRSVLFELLNRGKHSIVLNLKEVEARGKLLAMIPSTDILVEQFRPGVMKRLGLDYGFLKEINPGLIYCSVTGYGQHGSYSQVVGHDLNYQAWTGLLDLFQKCEGKPSVPPLLADIAGGAHSAVINILLALRGRDQTGVGAYLDIAMVDGLFSFMLSAIANWSASTSIPKAGYDWLTGGSPRYQLYRTLDDQHLAVAALENRFWRRFSELIQLPLALRAPDADPSITQQRVADIIVGRPARYWQALFEGEDVCCTVVRSLAEAMQDPDILGRHRISLGEDPSINLLSIPTTTKMFRAPNYGEHNSYFGL